MPTLHHLAVALAGEFDNKAQSLAEPIWYLHLRVWNRPLSPDVFGAGYGFFIEQISVAAGAPPYRQRILHLTQRGDSFWGQYYGLADPLAWQGSSTEPERLTHLTRADLVKLPISPGKTTNTPPECPLIASVPFLTKAKPATLP